jgi:hypothetical protein
LIVIGTLGRARWQAERAYKKSKTKAIREQNERETNEKLRNNVNAQTYVAALRDGENVQEKAYKKNKTETARTYVVALRDGEDVAHRGPGDAPHLGFKRQHLRFAPLTGQGLTGVCV